MLRSEIIQVVREDFLDDISDAQAGTDLTVEAVSDTRLLRWIQEAEREACRRTYNLIRDDENMSHVLVTGVRWYDIDRSILRISSATLDSTILEHTTEAALDRDVTGWRDYEAGMPSSFYLHRHRLYLDRAPSSSENGLVLALSVWREPMEPGILDEEPEIPSVHHQALAFWGAYRYFLLPDPHIRDDARALYFLKQFEDVFGPARSASLLEFKLEDPGWSDVGMGGYSHSWPGIPATDITSF